jgi:hypothetical protein
MRRKSTGAKRSLGWTGAGYGEERGGQKPNRPSGNSE